ncbi:phosphotransferase family protein [Polyangium mundeleinium]|uniref:Aminoglycoside phosphotransferase family protein n=1 Tax=Polyangium mundeleinium TaxID=2995306 RepID=A0ABT5EKJ7_9BACT|nr:aminoglycoside phosphotransferase family protein [Polyangium mundeleinium]MDC0742363.1 aminoglycoside phosphotransferase family protein [Polyangium mundeleinium]
MDAEQIVLDRLSALGMDVRRARVHSLRSSRNRPISCYALVCVDGDTGARTRKILLGKGYRREDGARIFAFMQALWQSGFGADPWLTIPEPVAYVPEISLLLQGRAPGKALFHEIDRATPSLDHVREAARWLAKMHATPVAAPLVPLAQDAREALRHAHALRTGFPRFAPRIDRIAERVVSSLHSLGASPRTLCHGDFQPKNIHVSRGRVTVIDFDHARLSHPARDVGHFIGQCMTMSYARTGSFEAITPFRTTFVDTYASLGHAEGLSSLSTFVPRAFLEILHYRLLVRPVPDPSFVPAWLDECERMQDQSGDAP